MKLWPWLILLGLAGCGAGGETPPVSEPPPASEVPPVVKADPPAAPPAAPQKDPEPASPPRIKKEEAQGILASVGRLVYPGAVEDTSVPSTPGTLKGDTVVSKVYSSKDSMEDITRWYERKLEGAKVREVESPANPMASLAGSFEGFAAAIQVSGTPDGTYIAVVLSEKGPTGE